jgi:hypothetical protein
MEMIHKGSVLRVPHQYEKPNANAHVRAAKLVRRAWQNLNKAYEDKGLMRRLRSLLGFKLNTYKNRKKLSIVQKFAHISSG